MIKVCVQGLGFVGSAMAIATALATGKDGKPLHKVVGVDLPTPLGKNRISKLNKGIFPFATSDSFLKESLKKVVDTGNLTATSDEKSYCDADIIIVDVHFDIKFHDDNPLLEFCAFEKAISVLGKNAKPGALIIIETTVPPGTCSKVVRPIISRELKQRGLSESSIHLAHSYERVMPGDNYLNSIINYWRVFAADDKISSEKCQKFLSGIINVADYPLTKLKSTISSETAKVMENTYRASNIAFIDEWTKYAEAVGVDLFDVINAIKIRPTHSNIMLPGLGVGGYCLTKDPAFTPAASAQLHNNKNLSFPFSNLTMRTNAKMPNHAYSRIKKLLGGILKEKTILILGVSYRQDVGDTRYSPAEILVSQLEQDGALLKMHDPHVDFWEELNTSLERDIPPSEQLDAVVLCVAHKEYTNFNFVKWLKNPDLVIFDANNVLSESMRDKIRQTDVVIESIGRGSGL